MLHLNNIKRVSVLQYHIYALLLINHYFIIPNFT
jgi:hypothetical protein